MQKLLENSKQCAKYFPRSTEFSYRNSFMDFQKLPKDKTKKHSFAEVIY